MNKKQQKKKQKKQKERMEVYRQKKHTRRLENAAEKKADNETWKMQRQIEKSQNKEHQIIKSRKKFK